MGVGEPGNMLGILAGRRHCIITFGIPYRGPISMGRPLRCPQYDSLSAQHWERCLYPSMQI